MTETIYALFPPFDIVPSASHEEEKMWIDRYENAIRRYNEASEIIFKNAPFMNESIHKKCLDLRNNCRKQILSAKTFRIDVDASKNREHMPEQYNDCWAVSEDVIVKQRDEFIEALRQYLNFLEKIAE